MFQYNPMDYVVEINEQETQTSNYSLRTTLFCYYAIEQQIAAELSKKYQSDVDGVVAAVNVHAKVSSSEKIDGLPGGGAGAGEIQPSAGRRAT